MRGCAQLTQSLPSLLMVDGELSAPHREPESFSGVVRVPVCVSNGGRVGQRCSQTGHPLSGRNQLEHARTMHTAHTHSHARAQTAEGWKRTQDTLPTHAHTPTHGMNVQGFAFNSRSDVSRVDGAEARRQEVQATPAEHPGGWPDARAARLHHVAR